MRSLYAAVQLLISRLLDFVIFTQKPSTAESESSAASMSRDRASGMFLAMNPSTGKQISLAVVVVVDGCLYHPVSRFMRRPMTSPQNGYTS